MAIRVVCTCGRKMMFRDSSAGRKVKCPDCGAGFTIPTSEEDKTGLIRWYCECGQRLKARPRSVGKRVSCPFCGREVEVPLPQVEAESASVAETPKDDGTDFDPNADEDLFDYEEAARDAEAADAEDAGEAGALEFEGEADASTRTSRPPAAASEDHELDVEEEEEIIPLLEEPQPEIPPTMVAAGVVVVEEDDEEEDEEGIHAGDLQRYFNATGGVAAARAGILQVLNGYVLYIPYACTLAVLSAGAGFLIHKCSGSVGAQIAITAGAALLFVAAWVGFVGCIRDGIFQRYMGVERFLYYSVARLPWFLVACILVVPLVLGVFFGMTAAIGQVWVWGAANNAPFFAFLLTLVVVYLAVFFLLLCFLIPALTVVEGTDAFRAFAHGIIFIVFNLHRLLALACALVVIGGVAVFVMWILMKIGLAFFGTLMPDVMKDVLRDVIATFLLAGIFGEALCSILLLYLSHVDDPERLEQVRRAAKGPSGANPTLLYIACVVMIVAASGMTYVQRKGGRGLLPPFLSRDSGARAPAAEYKYQPKTSDGFGAPPANAPGRGAARPGR